MTAHKQGYLFGRSTSAESPTALLAGNFDLGLFSPSWDHRCESFTACEGLFIDTSLVLNFTLRDDFGHQDRHKQNIDAFLKRHSRTAVPITGDAVDLHQMWNAIWDKVREAALQKGKGLRILVDLSTCPRYYSLGLIAGAIECGMTPSITAFYAEARYPDVQRPHPLDRPFSVGQWRAVAVPFLLGMPDPLKRKHFVVSVGFEGLKTARVLTKEDPDRISILFPDPGSRPGYNEETWSRNCETMEQFRVPESQIVRAAAGDAIAAWKNLSRNAPERPVTESTFYLCCGTKPHALGFALRALSLRFPTVLYNLPEKHAFMDTQPNGVYWKYDIRDLTFPEIP
jgi:hypothetical protein